MIKRQEPSRTERANNILASEDTKTPSFSKGQSPCNKVTETNAATVEVSLHRGNYTSLNSHAP